MSVEYVGDYQSLQSSDVALNVFGNFADIQRNKNKEKFQVFH